MPTHQSQTRLRGDLDTAQKKNDGAAKEMREARGEEVVRKYIGYKPDEDQPKVGAAWYGSE